VSIYGPAQFARTITTVTTQVQKLDADTVVTAFSHQKALVELNHVLVLEIFGFFNF